MKFQDLKLIQQLMILSNMIDKPDVTERLAENIYRVPDSDYVIDAIEVYTASSVHVSVLPDDNDGYYGVNFTSDLRRQSDTDKVNLEFVLGQVDDESKQIDKFGLLAGMTVKGDLTTALEKLIAITETLVNIGFVENNPNEVLKRLLSLIPIAESLPSELFERVYIDPIGSNVVNVIRESIVVALKKDNVDYVKDGISISNYFFGHILEYTSPVTDGDNKRLGITFGYGALGLNNVINVRVSDFNSDVYNPSYLTSIKVTSLQSTESVLETLKKDVYASINKHESKEILIPLADIYFKILDEARNDIIGRLMPF